VIFVNDPVGNSPLDPLTDPVVPTRWRYDASVQVNGATYTAGLNFLTTS